MPVDGVFTPDGYDLTKFATGVIPRLPDAGVELARTNAVREQWLRELEADGAPTGWANTGHVTDEGYDVFIGATRASMTKYNLSPVDPWDDAVQFNKPVVGGGTPPTRTTPDIAVLEEDPEVPTIKKPDAAFVGYPQGTYLASKTIVGKSKKKHTRLSPPVEFTIAFDGQSLEWQAAQDLPKEAYGEGLWLSAPVDIGGTPDPSTMRLQAIKKKGTRTYITRGPLKLGSHARKPPAFNETKVGKPKRLKWGEDFQIKGGLGHDLQPGRYKFSIVETTAQGESVASDATDAININGVREHHGFMFHPKHLHPDASGFKIFAQVDDTLNPQWYQLIRTEKGDKFRRFALKNRPVLFGFIDSGDGSSANPQFAAKEASKKGGGETTLNASVTTSANEVQVSSHSSFPSSAPYDIKVGHEIMTVTGGANTNTWSVRRGVFGTKAASHSNGDKVVEDTSAEDKKKRDAHQNRHFWLLAQSDPPTENSTGMEDPTGDIDAPLPIGLGRPAAGTWWVSYCRRFNGRPTQSSQPVKVTITASQVIELRFPPRVNKIYNALYGQLSQKNVPLGWTFTKQDATIYTAKDAQMTIGPGVVRLRTSGSPSSNDRHPRAVSYDTTDTLNTLAPANRGSLERLRATFEVSEYVSGRGYVELVQFDGSGGELTSSSLGTLTQNGVIYINTTIGDVSLSPGVQLNTATEYVAIRWGIENGLGSNRNLRVALYNLYFHPFNAEPRAFEERGAPDELWQPSIDPATPIPASHVLAIGPPPPTAGDAAAAAAPLDTVTHSTGSGGITVGSGSLPSGWTVNESNPGINSDATIAATTVFTGTSQNAAYFRSDGLQATNHNYFTRNYTSGWPGGNALSIRFKAYIERLPTKQGCYIHIAGILSSADEPMARFRLWHDGTLQLVTLSTTLTERSVSVATNLRNGDIVEGEIIVGGGSTSSGTASTFIGINGAARSAGASINGIDWGGSTPLNPRKVRYGTYDENRNDQRWTMRYDDVVVTQYGYAGTLPVPVSGPTPQPDRPTKAGVIRDAAPDGEVINQGYAFILPQDVLVGGVIGHETDEYFVKPGQTRTAAVFLKRQDIPSGMRIFVLAAYNAEGDRVEIGCLSEQSGANAVANTGDWYEVWMTYIVPEGYYRLRWEHEHTVGGLYVWQEPVDAVGTLSTLTARDAARVEARATTAIFSVILQARVPDTRDTNMENGWQEQRQSLTVVSQVPDALTVPTPMTFRVRGSDMEAGPYSGWQSDPLLLADYEFIEVEVTLTGDGVESPVVPAGGVNTVYSTYQPILCRANRTALSGGALIGGDSSSNLPRSVNRHDYDVEAVGGRALARALTDRIRRLGPYAIRVYTTDAEDEISSDMLAIDQNGIPAVAEWFIEDWWENRLERVRFYGPSDFEPEIDYDVLDSRIVKRVPRVMEVESTEVLEAAPLA